MRKRLYVRLGVFAVGLTASVLGIAQAQKIYNGKQVTVADPSDVEDGPGPSARGEAPAPPVASIGDSDAAPHSMRTDNGIPGSLTDSVEPASSARRPNPVPHQDDRSSPPSRPPSTFSLDDSGVRTASTFGTPRPIDPAHADAPPERPSSQIPSESETPLDDGPPPGAAGSSPAGGPADSTGTVFGASDPMSQPASRPSGLDDGAPPLMPMPSNRYGAPNGSNDSVYGSTADSRPDSTQATGKAPVGGPPPGPSRFGGGSIPDGGTTAADRSPKAEPSTRSDPSLDSEPSARAPDLNHESRRPVDSDRSVTGHGGSESAPSGSPATTIDESGLRSLGGNLPRSQASTFPSREAVAAAPGPAELEGIQTPSLSIVKSAPDEVQVGREATFRILVRNIGQVVANDVTVTDHVPNGSVLARTNPQAAAADGAMVWRLGALPPGGEAELAYTIVPQVEGELGSVAQVTFAAQASARTVSTRPVIKVEVDIPATILIGEVASVVIQVRNEGTGPARGVVIEEDVPDGLAHPAGRQLENTIGTIGPGESRRVELNMTAEKAGILTNTVRVRDDGDLDLVKDSNIEVLAPVLDVDVQGPTLRYLERQATYAVLVRNPGTAPARDIELVAFLPRGLKFVSATKLGQYAPERHAVVWNLEELPPSKEGTVQFVTLPVEEGEQKLRVEARGAMNTESIKEHAVRVESSAELAFTITDSADPIEIGTETTYSVEVSNRGTRSAANVVMTATLPDELEPIDAEGPTAGAIQGKVVRFEPVRELAAGERVVFRVQTRGAQAGDARILVQLQDGSASKPVSKEESTKVYED